MFPRPIDADLTHQQMILHRLDRLYHGEKRDAVAIPDLLAEMNHSMSPHQFDQAIEALMASGEIAIGVNACGYGHIVLVPSVPKDQNHVSC